MSTDTPVTQPATCPGCGSEKSPKMPGTYCWNWTCGSTEGPGVGFERSEECHRRQISRQIGSEPATPSSAAAVTAERDRLGDLVFQMYHAAGMIEGGDELDAVKKVKRERDAANATLAAVRRHVEERRAALREKLADEDAAFNVVLLASHLIDELSHVATVLGEGGAALLERVAKLERLYAALSAEPWLSGGKLDEVTAALRDLE